MTASIATVLCFRGVALRSAISDFELSRFSRVLRIFSGYLIDRRFAAAVQVAVFVLTACQYEFKDITAEYVTMPGWQTPTTDVRSFADLPVNAQLYIRKAEELIGVPG